MEKTVKLLFSLINHELFGRPLPEEVKEPLGEEELKSLHALSEKHDLAHLVADALYKNQLLTQGSTMAEKFQKAQVLALYRYTKIEYERERICHVFEEAGIPYVPLKGIIIRPLYPQPYLRTSCDIDILIHKEDTDRAICLLTNDLKFNINTEFSHFHDVSLFSPGGIHLELHFTIEENKDHLDIVLSQVWDHCHPIKPDGCEYRQTPEFFILHHIVHMSEHFLKGGCGIRPLIDLYLLRCKMPYDEATVLALCEACGMKSFYLRSKELSDVWFDNHPHNDTTQRMQAFILYGGIYGNMDNSVAINQQKKGNSFQYLLGRVFMPYRNLKVKYPILNKHKWLFPAMTVRRWLSLLSTTRRKRITREIKISSNLSQEKQQGIDAVLLELELK